MFSQRAELESSAWISTFGEYRDLGKASLSRSHIQADLWRFASKVNSLLCQRIIGGLSRYGGHGWDNSQLHPPEEVDLYV
jgi:hypothetical protein